MITSSLGNYTEIHYLYLYFHDLHNPMFAGMRPLVTGIIDEQFDPFVDPMLRKKFKATHANIGSEHDPAGGGFDNCLVDRAQ